MAALFVLFSLLGASSLSPLVSAGSIGALTLEQQVALGVAGVKLGTAVFSARKDLAKLRKVRSVERGGFTIIRPSRPSDFSPYNHLGLRQ